MLIVREEEEGKKTLTFIRSPGMPCPCHKKCESIEVH
jgi:hypothetical protein